MYHESWKIEELDDGNNDFVREAHFVWVENYDYDDDEVHDDYDYDDDEDYDETREEWMLWWEKSR